jgi:hypothetical protein
MRLPGLGPTQGKDHRIDHHLQEEQLRRLGENKGSETTKKGGDDDGDLHGLDARRHEAVVVAVANEKVYELQSDSHFSNIFWAFSGILLMFHAVSKCRDTKAPSEKLFPFCQA